MLSTLLNYRYYANDMTKSLQRVQQTSNVESQTKYYNENIGKVKDVDDFLDDYRLYSYALKAYGLEEQISAKGFIRKVIESDLTDESSFANSLADDRYRQFAEAFNFKAADATATKAVQSTGQTESLVEAYSEHRVRQSTTLAAKTNYFEERIPAVSSVDELLADPTLYEVALRSIGADPNRTSKDYVRDVFLGRVSDSATTTSDDKFFALADRFGFGADGTVAPGQTALSDAATSEMIYNFNLATDNRASPQAAAHNTEYYLQQISGIDDADDLVDDVRLFDYIRTAFGLESESDPAAFRNFLASDLSDPNNAINALPTRTSADIAYKEKVLAMRAAFNFDAAGKVPPGEAAQTNSARDALVDGYYDYYQDAALKSDATRTSTYKTLLGDMKTISDLLATDSAFGRQALDYVLTAFDLDPKTESLTKIRRVLESDASDPNSYVNKLGDERYEKLAAAFNFGTDGKARAERQVQSTADQATTGSRYLASFGKDVSDAKKDVIKADTQAYLTSVQSLRTLDDLLDNDEVVNFALKAYGLEDETFSSAQLRKIFTSDLGDRSSYVYTLKDDRLVELASAFNFETDGTVKLAESGVQQPADRLSTENLFLLTTLEQEAGETSEGTRLALYFLRKAPELTSTLKILADSALVEVVRTALSLPTSFSQLDIDKQTAIIEKKLDVADFEDPKKLDQFIARFSALYDLANADPQASSPILGLFSDTQSSGSGIIALL